ncbi:MAG: bZIP transcription factor [Halobacteria archaeon]|nr:bZIP transcription factor [Halobacteria archaeon]
MTQDTENEELESRVNELKATVNALTQEIVDMKERIRELENGEDSTDVDIRSGTMKKQEGDGGNTQDESDTALKEAEDDDEIYVA